MILDISFSHEGNDFQKDACEWSLTLHHECDDVLLQNLASLVTEEASVVVLTARDHTSSVGGLVLVFVVLGVVVCLEHLLHLVLHQHQSHHAIGLAELVRSDELKHHWGCVLVQDQIFKSVCRVVSLELVWRDRLLEQVVEVLKLRVLCGHFC